MKTLLLILLGAGLLSCSAPAKAPDCCAAGSAHASASHAAAATADEHGAATAPFARVALALRGCSSCSHCRSTIRQAAKSVAASGRVAVGGDQVEVTFDRPQKIPLDAVIRRLAANGLHDLTVLDVLFDAEGSVEKTPSGLLFRLRETEQSFPLRVTEFQQEPPIGEPLRLRTVVQGWSASGSPLSLELKYVIESLDPAKRAAMAESATESAAPE